MKRFIFKILTIKKTIRIAIAPGKGNRISQWNDFETADDGRQELLDTLLIGH